MAKERHIVALRTGGSGLTAAIAAHDAGAKVKIFEKADKVGGTTAWSGRMLWIPNNHLEAQAGIADSRDEALTYLMSTSNRKSPAPGVVAPGAAEQTSATLDLVFDVNLKGVVYGT